MYQKSLRISRVGLARSERRISRLSYLSPSSPSSSPSPDATASAIAALSTLPPSVLALFESAASLPHIDGAATTATLPDPSKRLWETGRTGYVNWAVQQLIAKAKEAAPVPGGSTAVSNAVEQTERVGDTEDIKAVTEVVQVGGENERKNGEEMDTS